MSAVAVAQLTDKQASFVHGLLNGMTPTQAAEQAGYAFPEVRAAELQRNPRVAAAIREETERTMATAAPLAVRTLVRLCQDKYPPAVQLGAAKALLDRTGFGENANKTNGIAGKSLFEMTADELEQVAARLRQARASEEQNAPLNAPDVIEGTAKPLD